MDIFTNFLKAFTEHLKLTNVILQLIETILKRKKKIIPTLTAIIVLVIAGFNFYKYANDISNHSTYLISLVVLLLCYFSILISLVVTTKTMNRELEDTKEQHEKEITKLTEIKHKELDQLLCEKNIQINRLKSLDSQTKHTLISNFYDLHRDFRNTINNIEKHHKSHSPNQTAEITTAVYRFTRDSLNYLSEIFTQLTGEQISACVKVMLADDFDKIDYNTAFVTTFARSSNTSRNRISYHESQPAYVKLSKNTDFMEVVSENRINPSSCFYQGNLREYALKLEEMNLHYSNTTEEYWRFYKGTIVAPIRIANKYLFYTPKNVGYNTIGFLCVDSESDTAFPPELEEDYTSIMRAFAAILYNVLSKYQFYLAELDRSNLQNGVDFEPIQRTSQKRQKTGGIWIRGK